MADVAGTIVMDLAQYSDDGFLAPARIARAFRASSEEVARSAGLHLHDVNRHDRLRSVETQHRLRQMIEIVNRMEPRFGSPMIAFAWYRSESLAGFAGWTAMQLMKAGRSHDVLDAIDAIDVGIYA